MLLLPLVNRAVRLGVLIAATSFCSFSMASLTGFLKIPDIPGESRNEDHVDEIEIFSIDWSMEREAPSAGSGRISSAAEFSPIMIKKRIDKATPLLMAALASGQVFGEVEIAVKRQSGDTLGEYVHIELRNVSVVRSAVGGDFSEVYLDEELSLSYEQIVFSYTPISDEGRPLDPVEFGWDLEAGTPVDRDPIGDLPQ